LGPFVLLPTSSLGLVGFPPSTMSQITPRVASESRGLGGGLASRLGCTEKLGATCHRLLVDSPPALLNMPVTQVTSRRSLTSATLPSSIPSSKATTSRKTLEVKKTKPKARADMRNSSSVKVPVRRKKTDAVTGARRLAQAGEMTLLEEDSFSAMVKTQYSEYLRAFKAFYKENGWGELLDKSTDFVLADFFDVKYLEKAIQFHNARFKGEMLVVRSKLALKDWRKLVPQGGSLGVRLPMPKLICLGIAMMMLAHGQRSLAIMTLTDFDMYLRPSEGLELTEKCVVAPVRETGIAFQFFAVIIRDFEDGRPDEVGIATKDMRSGDRTRLEVKDRGKLEILLNSLDANMMAFCHLSRTSRP
jgi:hypothetical protein